MGRAANIIYSTTRMWNTGDDFILFGVRHLVSELLPKSNPVVYNRNPDLHMLRLQLDCPLELKQQDSGQSVTVNLWQSLLKERAWRYDNSWRPAHKLEGVDFVIFAGTPEWSGAMVSPLVRALAKTEIPVFYLGIGAGEKTPQLKLESLDPKDLKLLERAKVITVRDALLQNLLKPLQPSLLPCPSLFCAPCGRQRVRLKRIALSTQGVAKTNFQRMIPEAQKFSIELFRALSQRFECALICHYLDEVFELREALGPDVPVLFSYDPKDYFEIYDQFDLTVTTRLHGAGICASMGIPALLIMHSMRAATAEGLGAELIDPTSASIPELVARIEKMDITVLSSKLLVRREQVRRQYLDLLRPHLK